MKGTSHLSFGIATALSTALLLNNFFPSTDIKTAFIVGSATGSLLVDIDNKESTIGQITSPISNVIQLIFGHRGFIHSPLFILLSYFGFDFLFKQDIYYIERFKIIFLAVITLCVILSLVMNFKENKFFKSFIFFIIASQIINICYANFQVAIYGVIFGMIGHIFLDLMTIKGDPLLYPIMFKNDEKETEIDVNEDNKVHIKKYKTKYFHFLNLKSGVWYETVFVFASYVVFFICLSIYNQRAMEIDSYNIITVARSLSFDDVLSTINFFRSQLL